MNEILNVNDMNLINDVQINKYVKVMFGNKSSANGYHYKIGKVNMDNNWNHNMDNPKVIGGFSVSTENKIIRWIFRGDTIYDVTFPDDSEIIEIDNPAQKQQKKIILKKATIRIANQKIDILRIG